MLRGVRGLVAILRVLAGVLLVASVALNFANVIGRYFFNASIYWAEEIMLFLMVGCVFLGNGVVAWSGRQIRMDVIVGMMPTQVREALDLFSELVFIVVALMIVVFAWPVIRDLWAFDQRSQSADVPMVIPQAMVPIGLVDHGAAGGDPPGHRRRPRASRKIRPLRRSDERGTQHRCQRSLAYFVLPAVLLVLGVPIFLVLLVTCLVVVLFVADVPTEAVQTFLFSGLDNFPLLAVPFFVLAGEIMAQGGIARRVVVWVMAMVGGVRGSLAVTTVAASEVFGAMAHTAVGTVVAVGRMIYPSLRENGYNERFAVGLIASSGAIAVVIPPSIAMILYSVSAQQSAVALFTAGILPSLLIGLVDALYVMIYARIKRGAAHREGALGDDLDLDQGGELVDQHHRGDPRRHLRRRVHADRGRRRRGGLFAVRDHGGAPRGRLARALAHHPELGVPDLADPDDRDRRRALFLAADHQRHSAEASIAEINALHMPPWALLLSINVILLIMGSFLEPPAAILILTPLLLPLVQAVGVDPIHFGIIMAVNLSIGMYTPPFGLNLFASQAVFQTPLGNIYRGVLPFLAINFATLMVITYVPAISMVLLGK